MTPDHYPHVHEPGPGVLAYLAWGTYRLQPAAWWGALVLGVAVFVNTVFTYLRIDVMEMYATMGLPAERLEAIRQAGIVAMTSRWEPLMYAVATVVWIVYLLSVRRYFFHRDAGMGPRGEVTSATLPAQR